MNLVHVLYPKKYICFIKFGVIFTGEVVPVGGVNENNTPILPGQPFTEKLSGKHVRVHGGHLAGTNVEPSAGGYQALLDATVLACEARVNDTIGKYLDTLTGELMLQLE